MDILQEKKFSNQNQFQLFPEKVKLIQDVETNFNISNQSPNNMPF